MNREQTMMLVRYVNDMYTCSFILCDACLEEYIRKIHNFEWEVQSRDPMNNWLDLCI